MPQNTTHLDLKLLATNQAQKEIVVNEALLKIDALLNTGAKGLYQKAPPEEPQNGDVYIIGESPTGTWQDHSKEITYYQDGWHFIPPNEGMQLWVNNIDQLVTFDGEQWISQGGTVVDSSKLGINTSADDTNRLSVRSDAVLFTEETGDIRTILNKASSSDTASFLFQTGYSGRAEFGLIGDDHFQMKVSPDGSNFTSSYAVENDTGKITFHQDVQCQKHLIAPTLTGYQERVEAISTESETTRLDLSKANVFTLMLTQDSSLELLAPANSQALSLTLLITQDSQGNHLLGFPAEIKWPRGEPPALSSNPNATDILTFLSVDGGESWIGMLAGSDIK